MLLLRDRSNVNLASNFRHFRGPLRAEIFGSSFVRALFPYKPRLISLWLSFSAFFRQPDEGSSSAGTLPRGIATSARLVISRTKVRSLFHSLQSFELKVLIFIRRCLCTVQSSDASTSWRTVQPDPSLPISPTASTFSVACGPFSRGYCSQGSNCPHPHLRTSPFSPPSFPPPSPSIGGRSHFSSPRTSCLVRSGRKRLPSTLRPQHLQASPRLEAARDRLYNRSSDRHLPSSR
jgi:hypothetical protein